jgi:hypothetical protein
LRAVPGLGTGVYLACQGTAGGMECRDGRMGCIEGPGLTLEADQAFCAFLNVARCICRFGPAVYGWIYCVNGLL